MNLPSASHVSRCGKPSRSWSDSTDKVPLQVARNCGYKNPSPEIKSEDMTSVYSDAGDTFASRPSNAASCEDHHDAVSAGLYCNTQRHSDSDSRDFILKRFLPAAQAMAATGVKSSASTSDHPSDKRHRKSSSDVSNARLGSVAPGSSKSKSRYDIHLGKQNVRGEEFDVEGGENKTCGLPLYLGKLTFQHFKDSFWTSRSSSRSKPQQSSNKVSQKAIQEEASDESDDLFWSDEEGFDDAVTRAAISGAVGMNEQGESSISSGVRRSSISSEVRKRMAAEMLVHPTRLHCMETVHTPEHRGFLGLPKTTKLSNGEIERSARQVDRLGARLTRMISKANFRESRNGTRIIEQDETETGSSSQGPSTTTSSSSVEAPRTKWVDAISSLMPPPSPKVPSESWLSSTLPPERLMEMKKLPRKSLGSFIPIQPPKHTSTYRQQPNREDVSTRFRQSCSLKEYLQCRYEGV